MSMWIEEKFIGLIGHSLPYFKKQSKSTYTFRCPFCGDSKRRQNKTRGYFFMHQKHYFFKCHNCNESMSFKIFLKQKFPGFFQEFQLDLLRESGDVRQYTAPVKVVVDEKSRQHEQLSIQSIAELPKDHVARKYCEDRLLPEESFDHLYFTDCWTDWIKHCGWTYQFPEDSYPRLILPWFNRQGRLMGAQARRIDVTGKEGRYITLKAPTTYGSKIYGIDRLKLNMPIFMCEGPLDSWFLPNCVAAMGSDLLTVKNTILPTPPVTMIWDNEPRNKSIIHELNSAIKQGHSVVIWPPDLDYKDLNDMVKAGVDVVSLVQRRTFKGLAAELEFIQWKR